MSDDQASERLEQLGERTVPPVDAAFANRLEAKLRSEHAGPVGGGFSWPDVLLRPAAVLVALMVVVGVIAVVRLGDDDPIVAIVAADGTTVSIPGGTTLEPGRAGLDLPDGTRIEVSEDGVAVIGGVVLEAGSTAVVVDGRLEVVDSPAVTATDRTAETTPTTSSTPPRTTRVVTTEPPPGTTPDSTRTAPPSSAAPVDTSPPSDRPTTTTAPTATDALSTTTEPATTTVAPTLAPASTTTTTTTASTTTAAPRPVDELVVRLAIGPVRDGAATLTWSVDGPTDAIAGWAVRLVRGDTAKTIAVIRVADARRLRVEVPGPGVAYRVIAWNSSDEIIARSALVSPVG